MATSIGSIYVQVKGDDTQFKKDMRELGTVAKKSGKNISEALNSSISSKQAAAGVRTISTELTKLSKTAAVPEKQFRQTADAIASGMKDVAQSVNMTEREFAQLNERMLRNKAMTQATNSLRNITRAAGLSANETRRMAVQMGYSAKQAKAMADKVHRLDRKSAGLSDTMSKLAGVITGVFGVYGLGVLAKSTIATAAAFETFKIQLETIQGSSSKAEKSMEWITKFAAKTPYELNQVVDSFVKLESYGLNAQKWMRPLGDTASSMGKGLNQAVEMFADALVGEFERLKEFGVRAKQTANDVTFSWKQNGKDMVITAAKTQGAIGNALGQIFSRFEGGMDKQSKTLSGMLSNMSDNFTIFQQKLTDGGVLDSIKALLTDLNGAFDDLTASKAEIKVWADAFASALRGVGSVIKTTLELTKSLADVSGAFGLASQDVVSYKEAWLNASEVVSKYDLVPGLFDAEKKLKSLEEQLKNIQEAGRFQQKRGAAIPGLAGLRERMFSEDQLKVLQDATGEEKRLKDAIEDVRAEIEKYNKQYKELSGNRKGANAEAEKENVTTKTQTQEIADQTKEIEKQIKALQKKWQGEDKDKADQKRLEKLWKDKNNANLDLQRAIHKDELEYNKKRIDDLGKFYEEDEKKRNKRVADEKKAQDQIRENLQNISAEFTFDALKGNWESIIDDMGDYTLKMFSEVFAKDVLMPYVAMPLKSAFESALGGVTSALGSVGSTVALGALGAGGLAAALGVFDSGPDGNDMINRELEEKAQQHREWVTKMDDLIYALEYSRADLEKQLAPGYVSNPYSTQVMGLQNAYASNMQNAMATLDDFTGNYTGYKLGDSIEAGLYGGTFDPQVLPNSSLTSVQQLKAGAGPLGYSSVDSLTANINDIIEGLLLDRNFDELDKFTDYLDQQLNFSVRHPSRTESDEGLSSQFESAYGKFADAQKEILLNYDNEMQMLSKDFLADIKSFEQGISGTSYKNTWEKISREADAFIQGFNDLPEELRAKVEAAWGPIDASWKNNQLFAAAETYAAGFTELLDTTTEHQKAVNDINDHFDVWRESLEAAKAPLEEINNLEKLRTDTLNAQTEALYRNIREYQQSINEIFDPNARMNMIAQRYGWSADSYSNGQFSDPDAVKRALESYGTMSAGEFQSIADSFGLDWQTLAADVTYLSNAIMSVGEESKLAAEQMESLVKTLEDTIFELSGGSMAPAQSAEAYNYRYAELYGSALTGDQSAISEFNSFISEYTDFMRAYGGYDAVNSQVLRDVTALRDMTAGGGTINVSLNVDGRTLAQVVAEQQRTNPEIWN